MILYKYMSHRGFLSNLMVRFTPPNKLNDPRELAPRVVISNPEEFARAIIDRNAESACAQFLQEHPTTTEEEVRLRLAAASEKTLHEYRSNPDALEKKGYDAFMRTTSKTIGVFSLTETNNNELMWSHYADSHAGFVVAFNTETEFFSRRPNDPNLCGELFRVTYTDTTPQVYLTAEELNIPQELLFTKTIKWSYEREWRMIRTLSAADSTAGDIHLFKIAPESVVGVIFGHKFPEAEKKAIRDQLAITAPLARFMSAGYNHRGEFVVS